jgi:hypothetical protein
MLYPLRSFREGEISTYYLLYSYRNAWMGSSLAARMAG